MKVQMIPGSSLTYERDFIGVKKVKWDGLYHAIFLNGKGNEEYIRMDEYQVKQILQQLNLIN